MTGRIFPTVREAIHATATKGTPPMKALASDLDWSPSELSMRTTLGEDNARPFPADDAHLVKLMEVTGDDSVLLTLADKRGYELVPKRDRTPALVADLHQEVKALNGRMQMLLDLGQPSPRGKTPGAR